VPPPPPPTPFLLAIPRGRCQRSPAAPTMERRGSARGTSVRRNGGRSSCGGLASASSSLAAARRPSSVPPSAHARRRSGGPMGVLLDAPLVGSLVRDLDGVNLAVGGGHWFHKLCSSVAWVVRGQWAWVWCGGHPVGPHASYQKVDPPCGARFTSPALDLALVAGGCGRRWMDWGQLTLGRRWRP
jgi:hypothetical protein